MYSMLTKNIKYKGESQLLGTGTPLEQDREMKKNLTYREITLLLGILVAMIILLMVWLNPNVFERHAVEPVSAPGMIPVFKMTLTKVLQFSQLMR
jgi:hypothetical protein